MRQVLTKSVPKPYFSSQAARADNFEYIFGKQTGGFLGNGVDFRLIFAILKRRRTKFHEEWRYFRAEISFLDLFREKNDVFQAGAP